MAQLHECLPGQFEAFQVEAVGGAEGQILVRRLHSVHSRASGRSRFEEFGALVRAVRAIAEEAGFSSLATIGRYAYPGVSDTVSLAAAAGATTRIGLLSGVLLAPTWPGALLAKEIASIDGVSGHRLTFGVGVGLREEEFTVPGLGARGRGARFYTDLETYRESGAARTRRCRAGPGRCRCCSAAPKEVADSVVPCVSPEMVRKCIADFAELGADELVFVPTTDDVDEIARLADVVS